MPYQVAFISLGCDKNVVNCEQMMALAVKAGHTLVADAAQAEVAVVNTCGFIAAAKEEAISNILAMAELKNRGLVKRIIVTGCLSQRYAKDIRTELPEVDGILGTGSFSKINEAIESVMRGEFYEDISEGFAEGRQDLPDITICADCYESEIVSKTK